MRDGEENTLIWFSDTRRVCVVNVTWLTLSSYKLCKDKTNGRVSVFTQLKNRRDNIINHFLTCRDLYEEQNAKVIL